MYARARACAHAGFRSLGKRFGRFGRFGTFGIKAAIDVLVGIAVYLPHVASRWPTFARFPKDESLDHCPSLCPDAKWCDVGACTLVEWCSLGTSWQSGQNSGPGRGHAIKYSLFYLSDFL